MLIQTNQKSISSNLIQIVKLTKSASLESTETFSSHYWFVFLQQQQQNIQILLKASRQKNLFVQEDYKQEHSYIVLIHKFMLALVLWKRYLWCIPNSSVPQRENTKIGHSHIVFMIPSNGMCICHKFGVYTSLFLWRTCGSSFVLSLTICVATTKKLIMQTLVVSFLLVAMTSKVDVLVFVFESMDKFDKKKVLGLFVRVPNLSVKLKIEQVLVGRLPSMIRIKRPQRPNYKLIIQHTMILF